MFAPLFRASCIALRAGSARFGSNSARGRTLPRKLASLPTELQKLRDIPAKEPAATASFNKLLHSCSRNDDLAGIHKVLAAMNDQKVPKDAATYSSVIRAMCRAGDTQEAEELFAEAMRTPVASNSVAVYNTLLNGLAGDVDRAFEVWWEMRSKGLTPSEYTLCAMIKVVGRSGDTARLAHVWDEVTKAGAVPGAMAHSALVVAYVKCGEPRLGMQVLDVMTDLNLLEDSHHARITFNSLLSAMRPEDPKSKDRVQTLLAKMGEAEIEADDVTFHSLMKNSSSDYIRMLMEAMHEGGVPISTETVNLLLRARLLEQPRAVSSHQQQVLQDLAQYKLKPDTFTYGLLVKGAAERADPELAFDLVKEMQDQGYRINHTIITSLISACSPRNQGDQTPAEQQNTEKRQLLKHRLNQISTLMEQQNLQHNVITATAMISAFGKGGMASAASKLFRQLDDMRVRPNVRTYNKLIHATLFGRYYLTWILDLVNQMESKGVSPNLATFNKLIHSCSQAKQLELAFSVPTMLEAHGLEPSSRTYANLVQAAIENGEWREGLGLVDTMHEAGYKAYPAYNALCQAASEQGSAEDVIQLCHSMTKKGLTFNGFSVQWPVKAYIKMGKAQKALNILNKVNRTEAATDTQSRKFMMAKWYDMVGRKVDQKGAKECTAKAAALRRLYVGHKAAVGQLGNLAKQV